MLLFRCALAFTLALTLLGCASSSKQTDSFLSKPADIPVAHSISGVPFVEQSAGHCGPATLAMAMGWAGKSAPVETLAKQVYTPGMKGSLQLDMITATRRNGMLAIPVEGLESVLKEVASGNPVIAFENLGISWYPQWHYALVFGYDLPKRQLILHSGPDANKREDMREFERSWKLGDYWALLVLPPGKLSATAGELAHVKAAAALEQLGYLDEAGKSYRSILERWPESLAANIGAANIAYAKKDHAEAVRFLKAATREHPRSAAAWHNLTFALEGSNDKEAARRSARRALELASPEEKNAYRESLKDWVQ